MPATPGTDPGKRDPVSLEAALIAGKKVPPDATLLLNQDHREAMAYFDWYENAKDDATRLAVATKLCAALRAHMEVEEEIFYPLAREAIADKGIVDHGVDEHKQARAILERAEAAIKRGKAPDEEMFELRQAIEEHVDDEESELFPEVRKSELDLYQLGTQLAARKTELLFALTRRKPSQKAARKPHKGK